MFFFEIYRNDKTFFYKKQSFIHIQITFLNIKIFKQLKNLSRTFYIISVLLIGQFLKEQIKLMKFLHTKQLFKMI